MSTNKGTDQAVTRREHDLTNGAKRVMSVDPFGGIVTEGNFSTRIDEYSDTVTYIGIAQIGTSESVAEWQIKKLTTTGTVVSVTWADGDDVFNNKWSDRLIITYS